MNMDMQTCSPHHLPLIASYLDLCFGRGATHAYGSWRRQSGGRGGLQRQDTPSQLGGESALDPTP